MTETEFRAMNEKRKMCVEAKIVNKTLSGLKYLEFMVRVSDTSIFGGLLFQWY